MIYFEFYTFLIPKMVLEFKYAGGIEQFKNDVSYYHEDEHLASARFLKIDEMDHFLSFVEEQGLHYNKEQCHSEDFAVFSFMGFWWKADWLIGNHFQCALKG